MNGDGQIVGALAAQPGMKQTCYVAQCVTGGVTHTLRAEGFDASEDGTGRGQPIVAAFSCKDYGNDVQLDVAPTMRTMGHSGSHANAGGQLAIQTGMAVRRLTPRECERLQGFDDDHTLIPVKKIKPDRAKRLIAQGKGARCIDGQWWSLAADGPRYKACGNSMAVPCMRFIGHRIQRYWHR